MTSNNAYFKGLFALLMVLTIASCKDAKTAQSTEVVSQKSAQKDTQKAHPGKKIMETKCYVCHNPTADKNSRIGPPMVAIKSHYLDDTTTKEEFAAAIWNFVKKPTQEKVKMHGAVKRFGVMPYQAFSEDEIKQIAEYMFDYKIEEPAWFKKHLQEKSKGKVKYRNDGKVVTTAAAKTPKALGMRYALATKKELGKNLMGTIQKKGTLAALAFCHENAYPITDSMATLQNAVIKRVSDKPRNPKNKATSKELGIIDDFKQAIANDAEYEPVTEIIHDEVRFYYPIVTNSMCLQCHGTREQLKPQLLDTLSVLYPNDKAVGYDVNEVRGIWSITLKKQ